MAGTKRIQIFTLVKLEPSYSLLPKVSVSHWPRAEATESYGSTHCETYSSGRKTSVEGEGMFHDSSAIVCSLRFESVHGEAIL